MEAEILNGVICMTEGICMHMHDLVILYMNRLFHFTLYTLMVIWIIPFMQDKRETMLLLI